MNILKVFGICLLKIILVLFLGLFVLTAVLNHFSSKEVFVPIVKNIALQQLSEDMSENYINALQTYCDNSNQDTATFSIPQLNNSLEINCVNLKADRKAEFENIIENQVISKAYDSFYETQCSGLGCIKAGLQGALSKSFQSYTNNIKIVSLILVILCIVGLFFLYENIPGKLIGIGTPLVIFGIPYFFIGSLKAKMISITAAEIQNFIASIVNITLEYVGRIMLIILILGAVLIIAGIILKITEKSSKAGQKET